MNGGLPTWVTHHSTKQRCARAHTHAERVWFLQFLNYIDLLLKHFLASLFFHPRLSKRKNEEELGRLFLLGVCRFFFMLTECYIPWYADYSREK